MFTARIFLLLTLGLSTVVRAETTAASEDPEALRRLAYQQQIEGRHQDALTTISRAVQLTRDLPDKSVLALNLVWSGWILGEMGRCTSALIVLNEAVKLSTSIGFDVGRGFGMQEIGDCDQRLGLDKEAEQALTESIALARRIHVDAGVMEGNTILANVRLHQGRYGDAQALLEEAYRVAVARGSDVAQSYSAEGLGRVALASLRTGDAHHWFTVARTTAERSKYQRGLAGALVGLSQTSTNAIEATALLEEALAIYGHIGDEHEGWAMARIGFTLASAGKRKEAAFVLDQALALVQEVFRYEEAGLILSEQATLSTEDLAALQKRKEAVAHFKAGHDGVHLWAAVDALGREYERLGNLGEALRQETSALHLFAALPAPGAAFPDLTKERRRQRAGLLDRVSSLAARLGSGVPREP